ncbi:hypothetical protein [Streptomyces sp. NPDC005283]
MVHCETRPDAAPPVAGGAAVHPGARDVRKAIGKEAGDSVTVRLEERVHD